eukprot:CAMPEP_0201213716 /NCGR_PEP_ID=MMETSP0851-20130426/186607_1 /ASSEMBLY_ACC=CAM_ASM_000631 /TAXON_ID=183588 /ORGANISM="Pseudo-nitzschia fraudulenta, Strain WWA7" /LENGTH=111 /DNA_ID=CAMNT_0047502925 /DNA_START=445 /DNA_END=780 /DNA_ORIENTATION=+
MVVLIVEAPKVSIPVLKVGSRKDVFRVGGFYPFLGKERLERIGVVEAVLQIKLTNLAHLVCREPKLAEGGFNPVRVVIPAHLGVFDPKLWKDESISKLPRGLACLRFDNIA